MQRIPDKIVTGFFVMVLGTAWYFNKCFVKPTPYNIIIYDLFGNQTKIDGIRTNFKTLKVTNNYILEYQDRFSQYTFSTASEMPVIKKIGYIIF